jgi:carnitine-CoA ligase
MLRHFIFGEKAHNMDVVGNRTVPGLFDEKVDLQPDKTFLIYENDDGRIEEYTYLQFENRVNKLANALIDLGIRKNDKVAQMITNSPEFLVSWFAINKAGGVMIPVNIHYAPDELAYALNFSDSVAFITEPEFLTCYAGIKGECPNIKRNILVKADNAPKDFHLLSDLEKKYSEKRPLVTISGSDPSQILFTSGTTSRPKGVILSHGSSVYQGIATAMHFGITENERTCATLPLFHVNGQFVSVMPTMAMGGTVVLLEKFSATKYWDQIVKHKCTFMSMVPMMLRTLLAQPETGREKDHHIRCSLYALPTAKEEWESFVNRFNVKLLDGYGLSETFGICVATPLLHGQQKRHCIGLPVLGREVRIVDENDRDVSAGKVGSLVIKGEPMFSGYYKNPEATDACLKNGWFQTGDNGYSDEDGYIYFFDRSKDVIKRAGENIAAGEVERVLNDHPKIMESAVIGVPDPLRDEAVKAFVVLNKDEEMTEDEVKEWCGRYLAKFKIPSFVEFRDSLPHTSIGKVIKYVLKNESQLNEKQ